MKKTIKVIIYLIEFLIGIYLFSNYFKFGMLLSNDYLEFLTWFTLLLYSLGLSMLVLSITYIIFYKIDNNS